MPRVSSGIDAKGGTPRIPAEENSSILWVLSLGMLGLPERQAVEESRPEAAPPANGRPDVNRICLVTWGRPNVVFMVRTSFPLP